MNALAKPYESHKLSVKDYHLMGEAGIFAPDARVELINGEIIDMAPIGNRHMSTVDRLTQCLVMALGDSAIVRVQGSVRLNHFSEPEPDFLILRPRDDFYAHESAGPADVLLLIEVADSSLRYDTEVKLPLYAKVGIPEVWIVDVSAGKLLRHAKPIDGRWSLQNSPADMHEIVPQQFNAVSLDLGSLFN